MEAQFTVEDGPSIGQVFVLQVGESKILGTGPGAELVVGGEGVAERHFAVRLDPDKLFGTDLGSPAGTVLNDKPLQANQTVQLRAGDELVLGGCSLGVDLLGEATHDLRLKLRTQRLEDVFPPSPEFEPLGRLGTGASGVVYSARRKADGKCVAIKVLREGLDGTPDAERFRRELLLGCRIRSPHVVQLIAQRVVSGKVLLILELIEGPSLKDVLERGPLGIPEAIRVAEDTARGLAAAAVQGVVHRDVKPGNILLSPDGLAKLGDFGIARSLNVKLHSLTASGQGLGTLAYMPPEQILSAKRVDHAADLYALGATLYHMLVGRPPFDVGTPEAVFAIAESPVPGVTEGRPDCPPALAQLVHALLEKEPAQRPPSAQHVADALSALREQLFPGHDFGPLFHLEAAPATAGPGPGAPIPPPPGAKPGERWLLGRFRVVRELGEGAHSVVYEALDAQFQGARCAFKLLKPPPSGAEALIARFGREVELARELGKHPGIVQAFDAGVMPGSGEHYCVMQLVEGRDLHQLSQGGIAPRDGARIVAGVARAVAHAHAFGVIHRDLKPENVIVTPEGHPLLTDFGIAKAGDGEALTLTGEGMGTPGYMAPEQMQGARHADARSDVYGLGGILYTVLLGGRVPFVGRTVQELAARMRAGEYTRPREVDPNLDPELAALIESALAVDPNARPPSAVAFAEVLEGWLRRQG